MGTKRRRRPAGVPKPIILRLVPAFSVLCQAQPDLRHVVQYGSRRWLAKVVCQLQALCGVLPIFFRPSLRSAIPSKRDPLPGHAKVTRQRSAPEGELDLRCGAGPEGRGIDLARSDCPR